MVKYASYTLVEAKYTNTLDYYKIMIIFQCYLIIRNIHKNMLFTIEIIIDKILLLKYTNNTFN